MSVVVRYRYLEQPAAAYGQATRYVANALDGGGVTLDLYDAKGSLVATHAPGEWSSVEILPEPDPTPVVLRPGTVVRIPGIDVPYVVDKGLSTSGPHATLTFTTADGLDWSDPRDEVKPSGGVIPPGAPLTEREGHEVFVPAADLAETTTSTAEAVLSETSEPYVSVATSVTGSDADEVLKVLRNIPAGQATVTLDFTGADAALVNVMRKAIRTNGAKSFGLKPDDDGPAGVREPVRS